MNDVVGGHVDFYFPGFPAAVPLMQGGKVKLLAVSTANMAELREQLAGMQAKIEQLQRDGQPPSPPNRKASNDLKL